MLYKAIIILKVFPSSMVHHCHTVEICYGRIFVTYCTLSLLSALCYFHICHHTLLHQGIIVFTPGCIYSVYSLCVVDICICYICNIERHKQQNNFSRMFLWAGGQRRTPAGGCRSPQRESSSTHTNPEAGRLRTVTILLK